MKGKIYKVKEKGITSFGLDYYDEKTDTWKKKFCQFKDHTLITEDEDIIKYLDNLKESEKHLNPLAKKILTQDEFDELVTPESLYVEYNGVILHIREVREGLAIAEKHGWKAEQKPKYITSKPKIQKTQKGEAMTVGLAEGTKQ